MANSPIQILDSTPFPVLMGGFGPEALIILNSSYSGRLMQYQASSNHPEILTPITPDVTLPTQLQAVKNGPVYAVWLTGQAGDTYEVRAP